MKENLSPNILKSEESKITLDFTNKINKEQILKLFLNDSEEINSKNQIGWTPLYRTIVADNSQATEILLEMGADPNVQCNMGETALFQAVEMNLYKAVEILLEKGADPNIPANDGRIPLHNAVRKKDLTMIQILLDYNSNPNAKNKLYGQTPLHLAMKNSINLSIIDIFLKNGADLDIKDKYEKTPVDYILLEETRVYLLNIIEEKKKEKEINQFNEKDQEEKDDENQTIINRERNDSNLAKFHTPTKIGDNSQILQLDSEKEYKKSKFESEISMIEKLPLEKLNKNKENEVNDGNIPNFNINNITTNFFSGVKNNLFSEFLNDTEKNEKSNISSNFKFEKVSFVDNEAFDLSEGKHKNIEKKEENIFSIEQVKKNINLNENKHIDDIYTIKIKDSIKFSLSDFQLKDMIHQANKQNQDNSNEKNFDFNINNLQNFNFIKDTQDLQEKKMEKKNSKNSIFNTINNSNNYATFENKNLRIDFENIDLNTNENYGQSPDFVFRVSQNTNNTEITQPNISNTNNNYCEKIKTPKSVFSPMTFFKNHPNTNSRSNSNSKAGNLYLLSEKDNRRDTNEKEPYSFDNIPVNLNSKIKKYNSNNSNMNTLANNNLIYSDKKVLKNDKEYILEQDNSSPALKNLNSDNFNSNKKTLITHSSRPSKEDLNVNINLRNIQAEIEAEYLPSIESKKSNFEGENYNKVQENLSLSLRKKKSGEKSNKIKEDIYNKNNENYDFSCDEKNLNENENELNEHGKNNFFFKFNNNKSLSQIQGNYYNAHPEYSYNNENENNHEESDLISNINYNEKDINNNFIKTGNYESFISKDQSRNSFLMLSNRKSDHIPNRSYCRNANQNEYEKMNMHKSNNFEKKKVSQLSKNNFEDEKQSNYHGHNKSKSVFPPPTEHKFKNHTQTASNSNLPNIPKSRKNSVLETEGLKSKKISKIKNNNDIEEDNKNLNDNLRNQCDSISLDFQEREKILYKIHSPRNDNNEIEGEFGNLQIHDNQNSKILSKIIQENHEIPNEIEVEKNRTNKKTEKRISINKISISPKQYYEDNNSNENKAVINFKNCDVNQNEKDRSKKSPQILSNSILSPSNIDVNYKNTENSYSCSLRDLNNYLNSGKNSNKLNNTNANIKINYQNTEKLSPRTNTKEYVDTRKAKSNFKDNINSNTNRKMIELDYSQIKQMNNISNNNNFLSPDNTKTRINFFNTDENISCLLPEEDIENENKKEDKLIENLFMKKINNLNVNDSGKISNEKDEKNKNLYINRSNNFNNKSIDKFSIKNRSFINNIEDNFNSPKNQNLTQLESKKILEFDENNSKNLQNRDSKNFCRNFSEKRNENNTYYRKIIKSKQENNILQNKIYSKKRHDFHTKSLILNNISPKNFSYGNLNNISTNKNSHSNFKILGIMSNKNLKSVNFSNYDVDTLTNSYYTSNKHKDNYENFFSTENRDIHKSNSNMETIYLNNLTNHAYINGINYTSEHINNYQNINNFADENDENLNYNNIFRKEGDGFGSNSKASSCISKSQALLLHNWLLSMNLAQYYNNFIENGLIDLESIISKTLENELKINAEVQNLEENYNYSLIKKLDYEDLERIGLKKPGHIFRILTRIEFDAKLINQNLSFLIANQCNSLDLDVTQSISSLRVSNQKMLCCAYKSSDKKRNNSNNTKTKNDFDFGRFFEKYRLKKYEKHFIFNGFDSIEYVYLQIFSTNKFDEDTLETKLHVYDQKDRKKILICLLKELKEINDKIGLNINLNAMYDDSLNDLFEEDSNIYDTRKVDEGCKACNIF